MGRQIAILMDEIDEANFIEFLRSGSEIEIFTRHALGVDSLSHRILPEDRNIVQFYIWNKTFPWTPSIGQSRINTPYLTNLSTAPVIEYMRERSKRFGRVYWEKLPDNSGQFSYKSLTYSYDVESFEVWYESIIKWIKQNSIARGKRNDRKYFLKNVWRSGAWFFSMFHRYS